MRLKAEKEQKAARYVIQDALDQQLFALVQDLKNCGLRAGVKSKRLRLALDQGIIDRLNAGRAETNIPGVTLLRIALERQLKKKKW